MAKYSKPGHPDTCKRQKPLAPAFSFKKAQGLLVFDFLWPNDCEKLRDREHTVNGFSHAGIAGLRDSIQKQFTRLLVDGEGFEPS